MAGRDVQQSIQGEVMSISRVVLVLAFAACIALLLKAGTPHFTAYLDGKIDSQITKWADGK